MSGARRRSRTVDWLVRRPWALATPAPILYAKYNGSQALRDGTGTLSTDAQGFYLSRATGERLLIDEGVAEGATVGVPVLHGIPGSVVTGLPATARRSGLDALSGSDYVDLPALTTSVCTVLVRQSTGTLAAFSALCDGPTAGLRARAGVGTGNYTQTYMTDGTVVSALCSTVVQADDTTYYQAAVCDGPAGEVAAYLWDDAAALADSETASGGAVALAGLAIRVGRAPGGTPYAWPGTIHEIAVYDGDARTQVELQAAVDDLEAGGSIAQQSATWASNGLVTGVHDADDLTALIYTTGAGAPVTAEYA